MKSRAPLARPALALLVAACGFQASCGTPDTSRFAGDYAMVSRGNERLPVTTRLTTATETCVMELLEATLAFRADGRWRESLVNNRGCAAIGATPAPARQEVVDSGRFRVAGDTLIMEYGAGSGEFNQRAVLDGDTLRLVLAGAGADTSITFLYVRRR